MRSLDHIRKAERQIYLKNAYRVLLTRARQGMVIVVHLATPMIQRASLTLETSRQRNVGCPRSDTPTTLIHFCGGSLKILDRVTMALD
jgi:hypothetical protein